MAGRKSLSIEELARLYEVTPLPIAAVDLETGMVLPIREKLTIVIPEAYENGSSGPVAIVETIGGLERFVTNSQVEVWHMDGKPFLVDLLDLPPEELGPRVPGAGGGGSPPPAHDAAGIVPVWSGPKRPN